MFKQRGAAFTVSGYLALALLALSVGEAFVIRHLYAHRTIAITMPVGWSLYPQTNKYGCVEPDEAYTITAADPSIPCGSFEPANVCCIRI